MVIMTHPNLSVTVLIHCGNVFLKNFRGNSFDMQDFEIVKEKQNRNQRGSEVGYKVPLVA